MDIAHAAASSSTSLAPLYLHISIYVTCLCKPEAVSLIPNCDVMIVRPSLHNVIMDFVDPSETPSKADFLESVSSSPDIPDPGKAMTRDVETLAVGNMTEKLPSVLGGGGLAVCASGPQSMTREAANAVAWIQMSGRGLQLGGVGLHTEVFTL